MAQLPFEQTVPGVGGAGYPNVYTVSGGSGLASIGNALEHFGQQLTAATASARAHAVAFEARMALDSAFDGLVRGQTDPSAFRRSYQESVERIHEATVKQVPAAGLHIFDPLFYDYVSKQFATGLGEVNKNVLQRAASDFQVSGQAITHDVQNGFLSEEDAINRYGALVHDNTSIPGETGARLLPQSAGIKAAEQGAEAILMEALRRDTRSGPVKMLDRLSGKAGSPIRLNVPEWSSDIKITGHKNVPLSEAQEEHLRKYAREILADQTGTTELALKQLETKLKLADRGMELRNLGRLAEIVPGTAEAEGQFAAIRAELDKDERDGTVSPEAIRRARADVQSLEDRLLVTGGPLSHTRRDVYITGLVDRPLTVEDGSQRMRDVLNDSALAAADRSTVLTAMSQSIGHSFSEAEKASLQQLDAALTLSGPMARIYAKNEQLARGTAKVIFIQRALAQQAELRSGKLTYDTIVNDTIKQVGGMLKGDAVRDMERIKRTLQPHVTDWKSGITPLTSGKSPSSVSFEEYLLDRLLRKGTSTIEDLAAVRQSLFLYSVLQSAGISVEKIFDPKATEQLVPALPSTHGMQ